MSFFKRNGWKFQLMNVTRQFDNL